MKRRLILIVLFFSLMIAIGASLVKAQEEISLRITGTDISGFPTVRVNLITADFQSAPLADLSGLSLRENSIPIGDLQFSDVTAGVNVTFVLDTNPTFADVDDDSGLSRQEKVRDSIIRYASQFMAEGDQVSIIVQDENGSNGRFLIEDATIPGEVIANIENYAPDTLNPTPLQEMMLLALAHAADNHSDGRFQAILLFTDGGGLSRQLTYSTLVEQAQAITLPVYTAIIGARADPNEIENASLLFEPTQATYVHMPDSVGTDPIYSIWQRQRTQVQITYQSLQSRSGRYPITVNLGTARAVTEINLTISPPEITFDLEETLIRRVGDEPDSPLTSLEPARYPIPILVDWPDGLQHQLGSISLLVDGQPQPVPASPELDANGMLILNWDISTLDEGSYDLLVQVIDTFGSSATSETFSMAIEVQRPLPPTPTAVPTSTPEPVAPLITAESSAEKDWSLLILAVVALVTALLLLLRRRRRRKATVEKLGGEITADRAPNALPSEPVVGVAQIAFLEGLENEPGYGIQVRIDGDNVAIGRDHNNVQIVLSDDSVAPLHARIKRRDGHYWLYDEGSANGTFRNYERLGLTPQMLEDQDTIHFGRMGLRFHLRRKDDDPLALQDKKESDESFFD